MNHREKFDSFAGKTTSSARLGQKAIRAALYMMTGGGLDFVLRLAALIILARLLVPEDFGLIAMVIALTSMVDAVRDLGLEAATIQMSEITEKQVSNLFWINASAGCIFFLCFCVSSGAISAFYGDERIVSVTVALSANFVIGGLMVQHQALLTRQLKQGELSLIRVAATIGSTILAVILAIKGYGFWALVWREILRNIIITICVWVRCPWLPQRFTWDTNTWDLLAFGKNVSITNFTSVLTSKLDVVLIGKCFGSFPLGNYRQAQQVLIVPLEQLNVPILSVALPTLSRLQSDPGRYRRYYAGIVFFICVVTVPLSVYTWIYAREIVLLILGEKWTYAVVFLKIFAVMAVVSLPVNSSVVVLLSCGKSFRYLMIGLVASIIRVVSIVIGVLWGPEGIAIGLVAASLVFAIPRLHYSLRDSPVTVKSWLKAAGSCYAAGAVMLGALTLLTKLTANMSTVAYLGLGAGIGNLVFFSALFCFPGAYREVSTVFRNVVAPGESTKTVN